MDVILIGILPSMDGCTSAVQTCDTIVYKIDILYDMYIYIYMAASNLFIHSKFLRKCFKINFSF